MKKFLHLMGGVWPDRELSVISCWQSDTDVPLPFISRLIPKIYLLLAICSQLSDRYVRAMSKLTPKAYHLTPIFFLVFVSCGAALAQEPVGHTAPADQGEIEIIPLKIGDRIPDELWEMYFPVVSANSDEVQYLRLGDFRDKLIILDFWATWCSPCVAMIPKMDSLQKVFGDKIQFLSVTYQKKEEVLPFLAKLEQVKEQKFHLPVLTDDEHLRFVFPHRELPHYVWINEGLVESITGYEEVNAENMHSIVNHEDIFLRAKIDEKKWPYDRKKPLIVNSNGGDNVSIEYHSLLAGYIPGLSAEYNSIKDSVNGNKVTIINSPLYDLYSTAFGGGKLTYRNLNRIVYEIEDMEPMMLENIKDYDKWIAKNGYSYEIKVPAYLNGKLYEMMVHDLRRLFPQYDVRIESRKVTCLILVRTTENDKLQSKSDKVSYRANSMGYTVKRGYLSGLINHLNLLALQKSPYPLIDETGYAEEVDLELVANLSDVESLNKGLEKYDLKIIGAEREIDMLVIRDNPSF